MAKFVKSEAFEKGFKTHREQIELLREKGMIIDDEEYALRILRSINYYRLSGYWAPFLVIDEKSQEPLDTFYPETHFSDVCALYLFDERLRGSAFASLVPLELWLRTTLGYKLGKIDPYIHLHPENMGRFAYDFNAGRPTSDYTGWFNKYNRESRYFRLQFTKKNKQKYSGELPIWAAVEVLDWGGITGLYRLSPFKVQQSIASIVGVNPKILNSWLQALRCIRNYSCHHVRLFNRTFEEGILLPNTQRVTELAGLEKVCHQTFAQLSIVQYLLYKLDIGDRNLLIECMKEYPEVQLVPIRHMGAPENWQDSIIWKSE